MKREFRKIIKHLFHDARHAVHMREDIADPADLDRLDQARKQLAEVAARDDEEGFDPASEALVKATRKVFPHKPRARLRENIEILVVAISVAMAFRTYFIQPFKIPTGSMQPTLFGIKAEQGTPEKKVMDYFPLKLVQFALTGDWYTEFKAAQAGQAYIGNPEGDQRLIEVRSGSQSLGQRVRADLPLLVETGMPVAKGQVLAAGRVRRGDHIFVDKIRYNFSRPKRGDIFVFATKNIDHPSIRKDVFYIKRLVGMPGEKISIRSGYVVADGKKIDEPMAFQRMVTGEGYPGGYTYVSSFGHPAMLTGPEEVIQLGADEYLPFGDNTRHSLDGRYFGGIEKYDVVGPAFMVYWPFGPRWGRVN
jgi:signal peptidase I